MHSADLSQNYTCPGFSQQQGADSVSWLESGLHVLELAPLTENHFTSSLRPHLQKKEKKKGRSLQKVIFQLANRFSSNHWWKSGTTYAAGTI